ncbi:hypothetical protein BH10ACT11_BH10ACT11_14320 [soil metagenome]
MVSYGAMTKISRYGKLTAKPGEGAELAQILLAAASDLKSDPGCELPTVRRARPT